MDHFLEYFNRDVGPIFRTVGEIFIQIFKLFNYLFNFPARWHNLKDNISNFTVGDWILLLITEIIFTALAVLIIIVAVKLLKKAFRFRVPVKKYDEMQKQVKNLQRDLLRANYEKDRLLQMRMEAMTGTNTEDLLPAEGEGEEGEEGGENYVPDMNRNTFESPCVDPEQSRFFRLTSVDNFYKTVYEKPDYNDEITLSEICELFRKYAASRLRLYYELDLIRHFIASMGTARISILQGISGTGKTSLPYAFGKFVGKDTTVVSVQPSWRERTELYGYYNEFTKKYTETEFLKAIYEANYYRDPHFIILDEMNIARVEYYFAEMLSILELPRKEEWKVDVVTATWENDPCLIKNGTVQIPDNVWFVGTINNDDSTFAVADKVYDRAIPIDIDSRAEAFECERVSHITISTDHLNDLFDKAKAEHPITDSMVDRLEEMNAYLIKNFRLAFGNRVMKQIKDYVPCFIACGGTEIEAVDFIVAKKVLRKFESLSLGFMKDELTRFNNYLDRQFGKNAMRICKEYVELLKKNN